MKQHAYLATWSDSEVVAHYREHRRGLDGLYSSEQRFAPYVAREARRLVDVGCAAGGFFPAWRQLNPEVEYIGLDVSPELVAAARLDYPGVEFHCADAAEGLPFPDDYADTAVALGWMHLEPRWRSALTELRRFVTTRLMFDVRLSAQGGFVGRQRLAAGCHPLPYAVFSFRELADALVALSPSVVLGAGYMGSPAATVEGIEGEVCFAVFVVEFDRRANESLDIALDLPLRWPLEAGTPRSVDWLGERLREGCCGS